MTQFSPPTQIACPHCGQTFPMTPQQWPQYQGRSIACSKCGQPFVVGSSGMAPPPVPPAGFAPAGFQPGGSQHPGAFQQPAGYQQMGPPGYASQKKGMSGGVIAAIIIVVLVVLGILLASILFPALSHVRAEANKAKCSANMLMIFSACMQYAAQDPNGRFPDSTAALVKSSNVPTSYFVCPASNDTPLASPSVNSDSELEGHVSYVYVGMGMTSGTASSETVIAYERLSNHKDKGMNVLYGDGHVSWLNRAEAERLIQQLPAPTVEHHKGFRTRE